MKNETNTRFLLLALAVIVSTSVFAGCIGAKEEAKPVKEEAKPVEVGVQEKIAALENKIALMESFIGGDKLKLLDAAIKEGQVNFYTSMAAPPAEELSKVFMKKYPKIKVNILRAGTSVTVGKIQTEREAGVVVADVAQFSAPDVFIKWKKEGVWEPYLHTTDVWKYYASDFKDPDGHFLTLRFPQVAIWYNVNMLEKQGLAPPVSWFDLLDPKYKGKTVVMSPQTSGAARMVLGATLPDPAFGWKYWEALAANGLAFTADSPEIARMVAAGEKEIGITQPDYLPSYPEYPVGTVKVVYPKEGTVIEHSPIGLLKKSPNPNAGKLFIEFVTGPEGAHILSKHYAVPFIGIEPTPGRPPITAIKIMSPDPFYMVEHGAEVNEKWAKLAKR